MCSHNLYVYKSIYGMRSKEKVIFKIIEDSIKYPNLWLIVQVRKLAIITPMMKKK